MAEKDKNNKRVEEDLAKAKKLFSEGKGKEAYEIVQHDFIFLPGLGEQSYTGMLNLSLANAKEYVAKKDPGPAAGWLGIANSCIRILGRTKGMSLPEGSSEELKRIESVVLRYQKRSAAREFKEELKEKEPPGGYRKSFTGDRAYDNFLRVLRIAKDRFKTGDYRGSLEALDSLYTFHSGEVKEPKAYRQAYGAASLYSKRLKETDPNFSQAFSEVAEKLKSFAEAFERKKLRKSP